MRRWRRLRLLSLHAASSQPLDLADCQGSAGGTMSVPQAQQRFWNCKQRSAVSGGELPFLNTLLNFWLELQQAERVGNRCAVFAGALGHGFLSHVEFVH